ncbi:MAG: hypothetical protein WBG50_10135 [Desulfomonilaceae bacterium]
MKEYISVAIRLLWFVVKGFFWDVAIFLGFPVCPDSREGDPLRGCGIQRIESVIRLQAKWLDIPHRAIDDTGPLAKTVFRRLWQLYKFERYLRRLQKDIKRHSGVHVPLKAMPEYLQFVAARERTRNQG